jgi:hypothetical protein
MAPLWQRFGFEGYEVACDKATLVKADVVALPPW